MQWGHVKQERNIGAYSGSNTGDKLYPLAYPTSCKSIVCCVRNNAQVIASCVIDKTKYNIQYHSHSGATQWVYGVCWASFGY